MSVLFISYHGVHIHGVGVRDVICFLVKDDLDGFGEGLFQDGVCAVTFAGEGKRAVKHHQITFCIWIFLLKQFCCFFRAYCVG